MERGDGRRGVLHHDALRDLQNELARVQPCAAKCAVNVVDEPRMSELACGEVDTHSAGWLVWKQLVPSTRLATRFLEHPLTDRDDEARFFGDRYEGGR